jgi:hypothetical protein
LAFELLVDRLIPRLDGYSLELGFGPGSESIEANVMMDGERKEEREGL